MVENTTHGSGWIVHIQPTQEARSTDSRIPPTGVGGSFKSSLQKRRRLDRSSNTTHGSGWIVQVQPTKKKRSSPLVFPYLSPSPRGREKEKESRGGRSFLGWT